jgi:hypothetical protein
VGDSYFCLVLRFTISKQVTLSPKLQLIGVSYMGLLKSTTAFGIDLPASYWRQSVLHLEGTKLSIQATGYASEGAYNAKAPSLPQTAITTIDTTKDTLISKTIEILQSLIYQSRPALTGLGLENTTPALDATQVAVSIQQLQDLYGQLLPSTTTTTPGEYVADWAGLTNALRATPIFARAFGTSNTNGWSLLLAALGSTKNFNDLYFAISQVRLGLVEDFTPEEIVQINDMLTMYRFPYPVQ